MKIFSTIELRIPQCAPEGDSKMPIDMALYQTPAMRGDISGTTISAALAMTAIADALTAIKNGQKPTDEQIDEVRKQAQRLDEIFDRLTGFVSAS